MQMLNFTPVINLLFPTLTHGPPSLHVREKGKMSLVSFSIHNLWKCSLTVLYSVVLRLHVCFFPKLNPRSLGLCVCVLLKFLLSEPNLKAMILRGRAFEKCLTGIVLMNKRTSNIHLPSWEVTRRQASPGTARNAFPWSSTSYPLKQWGTKACYL